MKKHMKALCFSFLLFLCGSFNYTSAQTNDFGKSYAKPVAFSKDLMQSDLQVAASAISRISKTDPAYERVFKNQEKTDLELYGTISDILQNDPISVKKGLTAINFTGDRYTQVLLSFYLGDFYFRNADYGNAVDLLEKTDPLYLSDAEMEKIQFEKGVSYFSMKKFDNAKPYLKSLVQIDKSIYQTDAKYYLGFISFSEGFYDDAIMQFNSLESDVKYKKTVPFYLSFIYREKGKVDLAIATAEKYIRDPEALHLIEAMQFLASLYFNKSDFQKSVQSYEKVISSGIKLEPVQRYELGIGYHETSKFTKAIEQLKPLSLGSDSIAGESMFFLADSYLSINDKKNARSSFKFALNLPRSDESMEISLFNYSKLSLELGFSDEGFDQLNNFIKTYPNSVFLKEAREIQITYYTKYNNFQDAIDLLKSVTLNSNLYNQLVPKMYYGRAMEFINENKYDISSTHLDMVLKFRSSSYYSPALFWKGEINFRMEKYDDAIKYLTEYLKGEKLILGEANVVNANYNLGYSYYEKEQYEKSILYFDAISSKNSIDDEMRRESVVRTADCYFMLKNITKAKSLYGQLALSKGFGTEYSIFQLAIIEGIKNPAEKIRMLKDMQTRFPESEYLPLLTMEIAETYISEEQFNEAIPYLDRIQKLVNQEDEMLPLALLKKGICYYNLDKTDDALDVFKGLMKRYPNSDQANDAIETARTIYLEKGRVDDYETFLKSSGKSINSLEKDSLLFQSIYIRSIDNNRESIYEAMDKYEKQLPNGIHIAEVLFQKASMLQFDKRWKESVDCYARVASMEGNQFKEKALRQSSKIYFFELKDYENSLSAFNKLAQLTTSFEIKLECLRGAVRSNYYLKNWQTGSADAESLLGMSNINPDDRAYAELILGYNELTSKNFKNAIVHFNYVAASANSSLAAESRFLNASSFLQLGELQNAEKSCMEAIKKSGSDFWIAKTYILLGEIFFRQKDFFNAKATLQSIIDNSQNQEIKNEASAKLKEVETEEKTIHK